MGIKFDDKVLVILATAPAGLGHKRVTEALAGGLSHKTRLEVMGINDPSMQWIHRLTSRNHTLRRLMEFSQENPVAERVFSGNYRNWIRRHADEAATQFSQIVSNAWPQPEVVLVLATHFGLAHQLAAKKEELQRKLGARLILAVVVTDDSPQEMWAVTGADVIFVPSNTTREAILTHLMRIGGMIPEVVTAGYPISLLLGEKLSEEEYEERQQQVKGKNLRLMVPVSGAAVQLSYYRDLMSVLSADGVTTSVVSRETDYTKEFLDWCRQQGGVEVAAYPQDEAVVVAYEQEYMLSVIGIEVTKPSEQAFKALYTPRQRGGSVLLFAPPVGRQEKDNLAFLRRHRLMPSVDDQARLNEWGFRGNRLPITTELLKRASHWRGILLPADGMQAGIMIERLMEAKVLAAMVDFKGFLEGHEEINCEGVKEIWERLNQMTQVSSSMKMLS